MIIVLDSNVWISQLGLNSAVGSAVRFFIKERKARVVLPEVIRLETELRLRDVLNNHISAIIKSYAALLAIFGHLKEIILPNKNEVENKVKEVFANTGLEVTDIPFSLESARKSLTRIISKSPPIGASQQFKDGVIWADCEELLEEDDVYFVTEDKVFFQDRDYSKKLNNDLAEEIKQAKHSMKLICSLDKLLKDIRVEVPMDEQRLANSFYAQNKDNIEPLLSRNGFEIEGSPKVERELFATEQAGKLYIAFTIEYQCKDIAGEGRIGGLLVIRGDGFYNSETRSFEQMQRLGEELSFILEDGTKKQLRNVVLRAASITIGHKEVVHIIRHEIE
jgi:hypothetical protein